MNPKEQEPIKEEELKRESDQKEDTVTSGETEENTKCEKEVANEADNASNSATTQQETSEKEKQTEKSEDKKILTEEEKLIMEAEEAKKEAESLKDKYLRLSAEFDNYRKRTMKEKADLILNGSEKSISSILPVVDDLERAIKNMETASEIAPIKEGIDLIYNKFLSILGQNGVKVIETKEQALDTDYHEAIAVIPAPDESLKGKILDCVQTGYTLNDRVMRHAKVVVGE